MVGGEQLDRDDPFWQVVDAPPAGPPRADDQANAQHPLHRLLGLGPVPPGAAVLGAAELGRVERALGAQPGEDFQRERWRRVLVARCVAPAPEREPRPVVHWQHRCRVAPILESRRRLAPIGRLDRGPADRAEARVRHEFVRARQHRDGVELDQAKAAQYAGHAGRAVRRTDEALLE